MQNFPTVGVIDGNFRQLLEETGMSFRREAEMIRVAHELDLLTTPYAFDPQEARWLADAGADLVVAHINTTTKGMIGVTSAPSLAETARLFKQLPSRRADSRRNPSSQLGEMLTEFDDGELAADDALRGRQEREIALGHSLTNAEYELAREAVAVGRTLKRAGIAFDPLTFVALRIVEGSRDEHVNAIDCLNVLTAFGFLERSVALAVDLLEDAA